ncbi:MAG: hypothetical protein PHP32_07285, partial [Candidatus Izemoplasmatales bacterium]|nr:hypothetical protein [Candidatus Izemoplasmatales bacterium]
MKIHILPIVSVLHEEARIFDETKSLLEDIQQYGDFTFRQTEISTFYDADLSLILVQSGGSEGAFLQMKSKLRPPYYLLTYGSNNSLAASMEILSYLQQSFESAEILHGSAAYIAKRLNALGKKSRQIHARLGVIGKPSDWLIASQMDYDLCRRQFGIELIDIPLEELIKHYHDVNLSLWKDQISSDYDEQDLNDAKRVSLAIDQIVSDYRLDGATLRCFDLLGSIHSTGCLGLSLLNQRGLIGTCEGDIPAMISMMIMKEITGQPGFMANPSRIDTDQNQLIFAHCTLPLNMAEEVTLMSHFESGIGVGIRGEMKTTDITIFKISNRLYALYVAEG